MPAIDHIDHTEESPVGEKLQTYQVTVHGYATRMRLNERDAQRMGATPIKPDSKQAPAPANKARTSRNKSAGTGGSGGGDAGDAE